MFDLVILADIGKVIEDYIKNALIPNWVSFVVQFAALVIMVIVVICVAYKPVKKVLTKRADYVESNIRDSEKAKAEAERNAVATQEALIASKKEAAEIIAEAKETAKSNQQSMIEETQLAINKMKSLAQEDIENAKQEAREEVRQEMISVALMASEEVLKREINEKDNARVVSEFIKDLDK